MNVWRADGPSTIFSENAGFIYDSQYQVGVCGDWLLEASIAGAWTSGRRMAEHLQRVSFSSTTDDTVLWNKQHSVGMQGHFEASQKVKQLGIASLEGPVNKRPTKSPPQVPMNKQNKRQNHTNNDNQRKW
eukprot:CAMPEP_0178872064 /NCGR_PEP_ID=MMETSP0747-20121128/7932_1 /TAXON_ID=913974 /ORGANISM="Nitzschia punctata, Strain CCMP561" /LENGTH=129 /DNA_ID=CAMNT_0020539269 /DNA_START=172 /DNA_END=558 /DNA_ORIENTATION=+